MTTYDVYVLNTIEDQQGSRTRQAYGLRWGLVTLASKAYSVSVCCTPESSLVVASMGIVSRFCHLG